MADSPEPAALQTIRRLLLAILTMAMLGTAIDLLLLAHYEEIWQWLPLALIAAALPVTAWLWRAGTPRAVTSFRVVMVLLVAAGLAGLALHYTGNREFQHEMDPALAGWALFTAVVTAKAPPALAPASMIQLGLIGLLATYRHPAVRRAAGRAPPQGR
jgi:hypothetical protein